MLLLFFSPNQLWIVGFSSSLIHALQRCYRQFIQLRAINVGLRCMWGKRERNWKIPSKIYHSLPTFEAPDYRSRAHHRLFLKLVFVEVTFCQNFYHVEKNFFISIDKSSLHPHLTWNNAPDENWKEWWENGNYFTFSLVQNVQHFTTLRIDDGIKIFRKCQSTLELISHSNSLLLLPMVALVCLSCNETSWNQARWSEKCNNSIEKWVNIATVCKRVYDVHHSSSIQFMLGFKLNNHA